MRVGALVALVLVIALQLAAITQQSLVGDGAYHLLAGHQALRYGENRLNLEHPPLVKLVAALPLLTEAPLAPPITVDRVLETSQNLFDDPERLHRVRLAARGLLLFFFGFPFLAAVFFLGREVAGHQTGVVLALVLGLAIPSLPNLSILQTDTAVALGFTLTLVAGLRYVREPSARRAAAVGLGAGLALAAKFSGVLVLPTVVFAGLLPAFGSGIAGWRRLARHGILVMLVALGLVGSTYAVANRGYDTEAGRDTIARYCRGEALIVGERMEPYVAPLLAVEEFSPGLAQWLTGLLGIRLQNEIGVYPTFAFGELRSAGRWWYFPAVLVVKTPIAVLLATLAALLVWRVGPLTDRQALKEPSLGLGESPLAPLFQRGEQGPSGLRQDVTSGSSHDGDFRPEARRAFVPPFEKGGLGGISRALARVLSSWGALLGLTAVVYLGMAMTSSYNLGVRHLLPILPVLYLPAARWAAERRWRSLVLVGLLALEALMLSPLWMSATNTWWLGSFNPTRFAFSIGDAEYRQNFIALANEARQRGVKRLHVLYPAVSEKELQAYLPDAVLASPNTAFQKTASQKTVPEPGWYAVNMILEQYLPAIPLARVEEVWGHASLVELSRSWQPYWREILRRGEDHGYIASTFHLYRIP